jgi:hypothetical protein
MMHPAQVTALGQAGINSDHQGRKASAREGLVDL